MATGEPAERDAYLAVDVGVVRHAEVRRSHLNVPCGRVATTPPGHDRVATRVNRDVPNPLRESPGERPAESVAASPAHAPPGEQVGQMASAQHCREDDLVWTHRQPRSGHGGRSERDNPRDQVRTSRGQRFGEDTATAVADDRDRLAMRPRNLFQPLLKPRADALGARDVESALRSVRSVASQPKPPAQQEHRPVWSPKTWNQQDWTAVPPRDSSSQPHRACQEVCDLRGRRSARDCAPRDQPSGCLSTRARTIWVSAARGTASWSKVAATQLILAPVQDVTRTPDDVLIIARST